MKQLIQKINRYRNKDNEFFYFYTLDTKIFSNDGLNGIRTKILKIIDTDCEKEGKKINDRDYFITQDHYFTVMMFATDVIAKNIYFKPLQYELFAFLKQKKDENIFSYPFEQFRIEYEYEKEKRIITILKFKVKCYQQRVWNKSKKELEK